MHVCVCAFVYVCVCVDSPSDLSILTLGLSGGAERGVVKWVHRPYGDRVGS